jgi:hypothetical protein
MIAGMRRSFGAAALGLLLSQAGCDKDRTLMCAGSIDDYCSAPGGCVLTWDEAQDATSFCSESTIWPSLRTACGPYHVIAVAFIDTSRTYYYDAASGMLTAIVTADGSLGTTTCNAGPASGFSPPVCSGATSMDLAQCRDGGGVSNGDAAQDAGGG